mmetsp:Transcript_37772/g.66501  ORF Transcript_37772/g.66501 Transcript_37772/m.66501 type:complete len:499 (-) Transcript_37772:109-1605(-)
MAKSSGRMVATGESAAHLRQMVHPLFAEMPQPRIEWKSGLLNRIFKSRRQSTPPTDVAGHVKLLAARMAEDLKTRRRGWSTVAVPISPSPDIVLAALAVAFFRANVQEPIFIVLQVPRRGDCRGIRETWLQWSHQARLDLDVDFSRLAPAPAKRNSYRWLREDTSGASSLARLAVAFTTLRRGARLPSVQALVANTRLLSNLPSRPARQCVCTAFCHFVDTSVMEVAVERCREGLRVIAVNAASGYHLAGGFLTGGRHALEESMCTQSTLFFSLQQAAIRAAEINLCDEQGGRLHIPEHGAILSPGVEVLRQGTADGYASFENGESVFLDAVISVAMPNMNPNMQDCPMDWRTKAQRERLVERKLRTVLQAAAMLDAEVVVLPDLGCGVYGNLPELIGGAFGRVLSEFPCCFSEVAVVGNLQFFNAAVANAGPRYKARCTQRLPGNGNGLCSVMASCEALPLQTRRRFCQERWPVQRSASACCMPGLASLFSSCCWCK